MSYLMSDKGYCEVLYLEIERISTAAAVLIQYSPRVYLEINICDGRWTDLVHGSNFVDHREATQRS